MHWLSLLMLLNGFLSLVIPAATFSPLSSGGCTLLNGTPFHSELCMSVEDSRNEESAADEEPLLESVIRMNDGGSDLTDRFKYKVNALMGVFDPQMGADDERQSGNILNAMLKFPVQYSFNVVGRTNGDEKLKIEYIDKVKSIVASLSGDDRMKVRVTPRGKNFTRITLKATVESVAIINSIYVALEKSENTIMQY